MLPPSYDGNNEFGQGQFPNARHYLLEGCVCSYYCYVIQTLGSMVLEAEVVSS